MVVRTTSIELSLINIAASLGIGIWIPLRLVFFDQAFWVDIAIELSVCALFLLTYHRRIARTVKEKNWQLLVDDPGLWILGLDILAAVPIVGILYPLFGKQALFFFVFKLLMLRHLFTVREILDLFDSLHPIAARLIPLGFIVPVVVHLVSCGWVFLGAGTGGLSGVRSLDYIRGVYWAVTTLATVGYGDISPKTPLQMAYASLTMIVGVGFFGYVLSNVASLLARMDAAREEHLAIIDRVEAFMRYNEVPTGLRHRIRAYYRYLWDSHKGYDNNEILNHLPPRLRSEVSLFLNKDVISKVPLLRGADQEMVLDVVMHLEPLVLVPEEKVFHAGEPGDAMYFIQNGAIEIVGGDGHHIATLQEGSFFGETALLTSNPRNATARATTYCDLFILRRDTFSSILERYPRFEKTMRAAADERTDKKTA